VRKVSREEAGLIELRRRLPDSALATFESCRSRLLKSLELEARYGGLTNDARIERQMTQEQLNGLSVETLGISFFDLCGRIVDWATASFRGAPGTTVQPDRMATFRLEGIDERLPVWPGGVNAYMEEVAAPMPRVTGPVPPAVSSKAPDVVFASLEIRLFPRQEQGYPVDLVLNDARSAGPQSKRGYLATDVASWRPEGSWEADGKCLFAALTADREVMRAWERAAGQAAQRRIQLWIDEAAPELHALPWELLSDDVLLSANADTPFSRMMPADAPWGEVTTSLPLRILAAVANPRDLTGKGLAPLPAGIVDELKQLSGEKLCFDILPPPVTLERLESCLRNGYQGLHIIAHGKYSQRSERAALWLEDTQGNGQAIQDRDIGDMLRRLGQSQRPRLVFLAACQSAVRSTTNAFVGLGPTLGCAGAPAVVAMQDNVSFNAARTLSRTFYERLAAHGIVDLALNEARGTLDTQNSPEAAVPVLFMRLRDGRLWRE